MTNQDLVQFHSSQQSLAGEIAYRKTMRDAGFSEGEIDGMILKAYLRGRFYRTWGIAIAIAAIAGACTGEGGAKTSDGGQFGWSRIEQQQQQQRQSQSSEQQQQEEESNSLSLQLFCFFLYLVFLHR